MHGRITYRIIFWSSGFAYSTRLVEPPTASSRAVAAHLQKLLKVTALLFVLTLDFTELGASMTFQSFATQPHPSSLL